MRLAVAVALGLATGAAAAVVLGDYPLSGSVPWVAAVLIPGLVGAVMTLVSSRARAALWVLTGPIAALSVAWGVRIATGWGLDPVPASCWAAMAIALVWPPSWGLLRASRRSGSTAPSEREAGPTGGA